MRRIAVVVAAILSLGAVLLPRAGANPPPPPPLEIHSCGNIIKHSFRLANDITNCPHYGLLLKSTLRHATINLNGHRLTASNTNDAIGIQTSLTNKDITVTNGFISGFSTAQVAFFNSGTISRLVVSDSGPNQAGILVEARGVTVEKNTVTRNPLGIQVETAGPNVIQNNTVEGNNGGIVIGESSHNEVSGNKVVGNSSVGIRVDGVATPIEGNKLVKNQVIGNGSSGIFISNGPQDTVVTGNIVRGNGSYGIFLNSVGGTHVGDGTTKGANTFDANGADGVFVQASSGGSNFVSTNTVIGNLSDGIHGDTLGDDFTGNTANENGANGIEVTNPGLLQNNTANTNGYQSGIDNNGGYGILVTGSGGDLTNKAKDNSTGQCQGTTCTNGGKVAPTLYSCGTTFSGAATVVTPMDCPTSGFELGATGPYTVDLGDHFMSVGATGDGVDITGTDATLKGGALVFVAGTGVDMSGTGAKVDGTIALGSGLSGLTVEAAATGVTITNAIVTLSSGAGIQSASSTGSIGTTTVVRSAGAGVNLHGSGDISGNTITGSTFIGNATNGVNLQNASDGTVSASRIVGNTDVGLFLGAPAGGTGSSTNTITGNTISANDGLGIQVHTGGPQTSDGTGDHDNSFVLNRISENRDSGFILETDPDSTNNFLFKNKVSANGGDAGIYIASELAGTVLRKNSSHDNDFDGIDVENSAAGMLLKENTTNHNGFLNGNKDKNTGLGTLAPTDINGCENVAVQNEDVDQILPHRLRRPC